MELGFGYVVRCVQVVDSCSRGTDVLYRGRLNIEDLTKGEQPEKLRLY